MQLIKELRHGVRHTSRKPSCDDLKINSNGDYIAIDTGFYDLASGNAAISCVISGNAAKNRKAVTICNHGCATFAVTPDAGAANISVKVILKFVRALQFSGLAELSP